MRLVGEEGVGEWLQAVLAGDLCFGAALGFVGQVKVFEGGFVVGGVDGGAQFGAEFALFVDGGEDGFFARFEFAQVVQAFFEGAQLGVVQSARRFFAVAGDEGHGRTVIEQGDGSGDLRGGGGEFLGEGLGDVHGVPSKWGMGGLEMGWFIRCLRRRRWCTTSCPSRSVLAGC